MVRRRHGQFNALHDGMAVGIDEIERELARAFVAGHEGQAQRHGALRMHGGQLRRVNRVERAKEIKLAVVVCRGIAEHGHLNVHGEIKTGISWVGTHFFLVHHAT